MSLSKAFLDGPVMVGATDRMPLTPKEAWENHMAGRPKPQPPFTLLETHLLHEMGQRLRPTGCERPIRHGGEEHHGSVPAHLFHRRCHRYPAGGELPSLAAAGL